MTNKEINGILAQARVMDAQRESFEDSRREFGAVQGWTQPDADDPHPAMSYGMNPQEAEVYAQGAAFYVALLKNGYRDEADEFQEWFLDTFDLDLES